MKRFMKWFLLICVFGVFAQSAWGAINAFTRSIDLRKTYRNAYRWTGRGKDLLYDWAQEVEDRLDGTTSNQSYFLTPTASAPTASEGRFYYDSGANAIKLHTGSTFVTLATAAGNSLDSSYDAGINITVDAGAVALTATDAGNNIVLAIVQDDAAGAVAQTITSAGTGALLAFTSNGTGKDILGTSSSWEVTKAGVATFLGAVIGTSDLVFSQFSESILNDTNNEFQFTGNEADVEDFSIGLGANDNKITFSSDSSADTIDFGGFNTLMGMTAITGDQATLTIKINANAGGEDLIIHQDGTQDASIQLLSDGTGDDAIDIEATAGGIYIETTGAAKDIKLDATAGSVYIDSGEAATDAIVLITTGTNGGIDITSLADIDITTTGDPGEDITLSNAGGSIILSATESANDAIKIEATLGGIDILASGASAGEDIDIIATGSSVNITSTENIANAILVTVNSGTTSSLKIFNDTGISATDGAASIQISSDLGGIELLSGLAAANAIRLNAAGTTSSDAVVLETTDGGILLNADGGTNGDIELNAASVITLVAADAAGILITTNTKTLRYETFAISAGIVSATEVIVGNGGQGLLCVGLESGVSEIGSTEGYVEVSEAADFLRFWIPLPDTWVDTGVDADLLLQFDILEVAAEDLNIDVRIFEYANTSAILTDTIAITDAAGRAWVNLVVKGSGFGADSDVDGDDNGYIIEITQEGSDNAEDFKIFGIRWKYRVGLQATQ